MVGAPRLDDMITFSSPSSCSSSTRPSRAPTTATATCHRDFPRLIKLWKEGRLDLEGMITRRIQLDDINDAVEALKGGGEIRQVIEIG